MSVSVPRQPFAVLDSPRLAHLSSSKNRQNGASPTPAPLKPVGFTFSPDKPTTLNSPSKRRHFDLTTSTPSANENQDPEDGDNENNDSENQPPLLSPTKRAKFSLTSTTTTPPPKTLSAVPGRLLHATPIRKPSSAARTPRTAPAGRSPPRKSTTGGLAASRKARRVSAPFFSRIDPPSSFLSSSSRRTTALPFSLDAALCSTFSSSSSATFLQPALAEKKTTVAVGGSWDFEIYEDSPEEEAAVLMEHSTLTLDLSDGSEDDAETAARKRVEGRGKENVAPGEGFVGAAVSSISASTSAAAVAVAGVAEARDAIPRRKIVIPGDEAMDEGLRSPLSALETADFFAEGLGAEAVVLVAACDGFVAVVGAGNEVAAAGKVDEEEEKKKKKRDESLLEKIGAGEVAEGQIVVFEDEVEVEVQVEVGTGEKRKRGAVVA